MSFHLLYDSHITTWKEYYFDYNRVNYSKMDKHLQSEDWDSLFSDNKVNVKWAIFKGVLNIKFVPSGKGALDKTIHG